MARDEKRCSYQGAEIQLSVVPCPWGQLLGIRVAVDEFSSNRAADSSNHFRRSRHGNQLFLKFVLDIWRSQDRTDARRKRYAQGTSVVVRRAGII